jgi:hypothetical protein
MVLTCSKRGLEELATRRGDAAHRGGMLLGDGCRDDHSNNPNPSHHCVWGALELILV